MSRPLDRVPRWLRPWLPVWLLLRLGWTHRDIEDRKIVFMLKSLGAWDILEDVQSKIDRGG